MNLIVRGIVRLLGHGDTTKGRELYDDVIDLARERRRQGVVIVVLRGAWDLVTLIARPRSPMTETGARTWTRLLPDLRHGLRHWRRRPGLAIAAVATLGLGLAASVVTFSVVNGVLLRPLPYPEAERLAVVWNTYPAWRGHPILGHQWDTVQLSWPEYVDARSGTRSVEQLSLYSPRRVMVADDRDAYELNGGVVTSSFLPLLGARAALGRTFHAGEDESASDAIVLSYEFWQARLGGRPNVVGQTLRFGTRSVTVVGVLEPGFAYRDEAFWRPIGIDAAENRDRGLHVYEAVARLAEDATPEAAAIELAPILGAGRSADYQGARVVSLLERRVGAARTPLLVILAAAGLLLVVACANVSGLLVGSLTSRGTEIGVRRALGAGRAQLVREVLGEGVVLASGATALGVFLAFAAMPAVLRLLPADTPRAASVSIDVGVLATTAAVGCATVLLFSLGPVALLRRVQLLDPISQAGRGLVPGWRLQAGLAVGEVALAVVLLAGAGLLVRTFTELNQVDPGFRSDGLVTARLSPPAWRYQTVQAVLDLYGETVTRAVALPGVTAGATVSALAFADGGTSSSIGLRRLPPDGSEPEAERRLISPDYFRTMGIPLLAGRRLTSADTRDTPYVTVVSEALAEQLFGGNAVGEEIEWDDEWFRIVGVAGDVRHQALGTEASPTFYVSTTQVGARNLRLAVRTEEDVTQLAGALTGLVRSIDPQVVVSDVNTMPGLIAQSLQGERFRMALISAFATLALILCGVGIYAAIARTVTERRREIGVRMALGAHPRNVVHLIVRQGAAVVVIGVTAGAAASMVAVRWVRSLLFGVSPADPTMISAVVGLFVILVLASTALPARRAAGIDPAETIREP